MQCIFQPILMKYDSSKYIEAQIPNEPVFAFCGIKDANSFFKSILKFGIKIKGKKSFRDHYNYNEVILKKLSNMIEDLKIKKIITTEKDIVKISETFINNFEIYIIRISVNLNTGNGELLLSSHYPAESYSGFSFDHFLSLSILLSGYSKLDKT